MRQECNIFVTLSSSKLSEKLDKLCKFYANDFLTFVTCCKSNRKNIFKDFLQIFSPELIIKHKKEQLETFKSQLYQRVDHITAGLSGLGLRMIMLNTEDALELLYNSYNPSLQSANIINDIESMEVQNQTPR